MSDAVFPVLPGRGWSVEKWPEFSTIVRTAANGAETRTALWSSPRWHFKLTHELLRDDATNELRTLMGFFLARQGQWDDFLFLDPDDNSVTGQSLGVGDGVTTAFQCIRAFGGYAEPVRAVNSGAPMTVYVGGAALSSSAWSLGATGLLTLAMPPASGAAVTADFSFWFRVRFAMDIAQFSQFMKNLWELKTCELVSVK